MKAISEFKYSVQNPAGNEWLIVNKQDGTGYKSYKVKLSDLAEYINNSGPDIDDSIQLWENGPYWATKNLGADNPEDFGMYFSFGCTKGYYWSNGKYTNLVDDYGHSFERNEPDGCTERDTINDWINRGILAWNSDHTAINLTSSYDAAHQILGSEWSIPTESDFEQLLSNCDWKDTTLKGVKGYEFTGRGNFQNKSIFLPCAGSATGRNAPNIASFDIYTSSSMDTDDQRIYGEGGPWAYNRVLRLVGSININETAPNILDNSGQGIGMAIRAIKRTSNNG